MKTFLEYLNESLTFPPNPEITGETELRNAITSRKGEALRYGDMLIRWFRDDFQRDASKTADVKAWIKKMFQAVQDYADASKTLDMAGESYGRTDAGGGTVLDMTDIGKIRRSDAFAAGVEKMKLLAGMFEPEGRFTVARGEMKDIRLLGSTEHVQLWATENYDTTNKFVFHIWQNAKTLGQGSAWGNPAEQSPYCTHSKQHWDQYSKSDPDYTQYWFLRRPDGAPDAHGDLSGKEVMRAYRMLKGTKAEAIICQNDTFMDLRDENDRAMYSFDDESDSGERDFDYDNATEFGDECWKLHDDCLQKLEWRLEDGYKVSGNRLYEKRKGLPEGFAPRAVHVEGSSAKTLKGLPPECGRLALLDMENLETLEDSPICRIAVLVNLPKLKSLKGLSGKIEQDFDTGIGMEEERAYMKWRAGAGPGDRFPGIENPE